MEAQILLVEDDIRFVNTFKRAIAGRFQVTSAATAGEGFRYFRQRPNPFDVIILDVNLPDMQGDELAQMIHKHNPRQEILFATGDLTPTTLVRLLKSGRNSDFIAKGCDAEGIIVPIEAAIKRYRHEKMLIDPNTSEEPDQIESDLLSIGLTGRSKEMHAIFNVIRDYRDACVDILITGETGTGKEKVAEALKTGPMFSVNCARYEGNEQFLETELFGHVKGAFTGADRETTGVFELANNGTVFLDEIHTLSSTAQARLLRTLQGRTIRKVGATCEREIKSNFRLITAGKATLHGLVEQGKFSPDLYFRIRKGRIHIPPLAQRRDDIEPLVKHFLKTFTKRYNKTRYIVSSCIRELEQLAWPGNVRELESCIEQLVIHSKSEVIDLPDLRKQFSAVVTQDADDKSSEHSSTVNFNFFRQTCDSEFLIQALSVSSSVTEAAERAKMPRTTLISRLKRLGINAESHLKK